MAISHTSHSHKLLLPLLLPIQLSYSFDPYRNHTDTPPATIPPATFPCWPEHQASALLRLRRSFSSTNDSACTLESWCAGTDCCLWEGVDCDAYGSVIGLDVDLGGCGLESAGLHPALFDLTSLTYLDLSGNSFNESELPAVGFERLTKLNHLNLSYSNFIGMIP